jgi:putative addiction module component (TIGR02574 family)
MTTNAERILAEAMALDSWERNEIAERLLGSIEPSTDAGYIAAWDEEIGRRVQDLESGAVKTVSWEEAIANIRRGGRDAEAK